MDKLNLTEQLSNKANSSYVDDSLVISSYNGDGRIVIGSYKEPRDIRNDIREELVKLIRNDQSVTSVDKLIKDISLRVNQEIKNRISKWDFTDEIILKVTDKKYKSEDDLKILMEEPVIESDKSVDSSIISLSGLSNYIYSTFNTLSSINTTPLIHDIMHHRSAYLSDLDLKIMKLVIDDIKCKVDATKVYNTQVNVEYQTSRTAIAIIEHSINGSSAYDIEQKPFVGSSYVIFDEADHIHSMKDLSFVSSGVVSRKYHDYWDRFNKTISNTLNDLNLNAMITRECICELNDIEITNDTKAQDIIGEYKFSDLETDIDIDKLVNKIVESCDMDYLAGNIIKTAYQQLRLLRHTFEDTSVPQFDNLEDYVSVFDLMIASKAF